MKAFVVEDGVAVPFDQADVDTDQILPARYLRRPRQGGYGTFLFRDVRFNDDDSERPDFILNQAPYRSATIMVADRNFGCGSSREQAPWGLVDHGIRCVIAADFGDIFYLNSLKTGLLPVQLDIAVCVRMREQLHAHPGARMLFTALRRQSHHGGDRCNGESTIGNAQKDHVGFEWPLE